MAVIISKKAKAKKKAKEPREIMHEGKPLFSHADLYGPTPGCDGKIVSANGGGVKCTKCDGWFCY